MTEAKAEARLKKLKVQQAELAAQIKMQEKKVKEREEKKLNDRRIEIGILAEKAGVVAFADDVILAALKSIKTEKSGVDGTGDSK